MSVFLPVYLSIFVHALTLYHVNFDLIDLSSSIIAIAEEDKEVTSEEEKPESPIQFGNCHIDLSKSFKGSTIWMIMQ